MTGILGHRGLLLKPMGAGSGWVTAQSWTPDSNDTGWSGYTIRVRIKAAQIVAGSRFRLTLDNGTNPIAMSSQYIQTRNMAGDTYDFSTTPIQVMYAGSPTISSGSGGTFVSDEILLSQTATEDIIISSYFSGATNLRRKNGITGWEYYFKIGNDSSTVDASGYSGVATAVMFPLVEVFQP